ncbi:hypothetical protein [uncultured Sneathiella sp.]|uniref:hypothetical protein n=1 Tax=uncultured Sneathiella sp. TaxID=879315 RepID=UPI0025938857|nr:hypothetical protein [uncultured Sneathiella sp.]
MRLNSLLPYVPLLLLPATALAADDHDHNHNHAQGTAGFYGHLDIKVYYDHVYKAEEADEEIDEAYTHSHLEMGYGFGNGFSVNTNIELEGEPAGHDHGGGGATLDGSNRYFEDTPLFVRALTVNYDDENFGAYAGKFDPVISFDQHVMPGIYGYQIVDEYTVRENIGVGGYGRINAGDFGTHRIDVSTFFADTTFLSNSILYERGVTHKSDGGVSNTDNFSSVAVSIGGSDFYSLNSDIPEGLSYRIGYAHQAAGEEDETSEDRYTFSGQYEHVFTADLKGRVLGEIVYINHLNGEVPHDRTYNTVGAELDYQQWSLGSTYTYVQNENPEDADEAQDGEVFQASLSYNFANGITLGAGYKYQEEEGEKNHRIGALIGYSLAF